RPLPQEQGRGQGLHGRLLSKDLSMGEVLAGICVRARGLCKTERGGSLRGNSKSCRINSRVPVSTVPPERKGDCGEAGDGTCPSGPRAAQLRRVEADRGEHRKRERRDKEEPGGIVELRDAGHDVEGDPE